MYITDSLDVQFWLVHLMCRTDSLFPDAGKDWEQEKKGATEDEMVGWHNQLNAHEFEQTQEIAKDREAWRAAVHEVAESDTT